VTASVDAGARLAAGGQIRQALLPPTVLASNVSVNSPAFREEIFGPVAPVTPFDTLDQAVELARDTRVRLVTRHSHARRDERHRARANGSPAERCTFNDQKRSATRSSIRSAA